MDIDARAFGQLEGDVRSLAKTLEAQNKTLASQNRVLEDLSSQVEGLRMTLAEAKGGWRTLMWLGGAASVMGGCVTWVLSHVRFTP